MEVRVLVQTGRVTRVGVIVVGAREVCVVTLRAGKRTGYCGSGHRGGTRLGTIVVVFGVSWRSMRLVTVMTGTQLLRLDVRPLLTRLGR